MPMLEVVSFDGAAQLGPMDQADQDQVIAGRLREPVQQEASDQIMSLGHPEQAREQDPLISNSTHP
jgi:hypothetical protein